MHLLEYELVTPVFLFNKYRDNYISVKRRKYSKYFSKLHEIMSVYKVNHTISNKKTFLNVFIFYIKKLN